MKQHPYLFLAAILLMALSPPANAQSYNFAQIPWGTPRASVFERLQGLGYSFDKDHGEGRVTFTGPETMLYASFDGGRLVGISRSLQVNGAQNITNQFHRLADSLRQSLGNADSAFITEYRAERRVWKARGRREWVRLESNAEEDSDSTFPYLSISNEGPGYAQWNARYEASITRRVQGELLAWIYEKAPQSRWELLHHEPDQAVLYERARVTRLPPSMWRAWFRTVFREVTSARNGLQYDITLEDREVDCSGRRSRHHEFVAYLGTDVVESSAQTGAWVRWIPESVGEAMFEGFCRRVAPRR